MTRTTRKKKSVFRYGLPLAGLTVIAALLVWRSGHLTAEIPTDQNPDPWPLNKEECGVEQQ
jgi:hypothetical protein